MITPLESLKRLIERETQALKRYRELAKEYEAAGKHKQAKQYKQQIKQTEYTLDVLTTKQSNIEKREGGQN